MVPRTDVSVVMPARNVATMITGQLGALAAQDTRQRWEVVVADNGSTDRTRDIVRTAAATFPVPLRTVDASRRPGINVARNVGVEQALGGKLLFCDADDVVSPGWVDNLASALDDLDLVGGAIDTERLNSEHARRRRPMVVPVEFHGYFFATGANIGCRRVVWECLAGFDEDISQGWDDFDFCFRAQRAGFSTGAAPEAVVHYQLREDMLGFVRQQFGIGRGEARFRRRQPDFSPPLGIGTEAVGIARAAAGIVRLAAKDRDERDIAIGLVSGRVGRLVEWCAPRSRQVRAR